MTEIEFFNNIEAWISSEISTWNHITYLAYFCNKYKAATGVNFKLVRTKNGIERGKEAADFAKLYRTFAPENYQELDKEQKDKIRSNLNIKIKNYINWIFDYKLRRADKSVTGTRFLLINSIINEFEQMYAKYLNKKQVENKIDKLLSWCNQEAKGIFDAHQLEKEDDVKLIKRYADMYELKEDSLERKVLEKAIEIGII